MQTEERKSRKSHKQDSFPEAESSTTEKPKRQLTEKRVPDFYVYPTTAVSKETLKAADIN